MTGPVVGLDHVQLAAPVGCEAEARRFYGELLGLEELAKPPLLAARGGVWFRIGDAELHIGAEEAFAPTRKAHPALRVVTVTALEMLAEQLQASGLDVRWPDQAELPRATRFYVHDPWGNRLELLA